MVTRNDTTDSTRQAKALALIEAGMIRLHPGTGTATAHGRDGAIYLITKADGCPCPDRIRRGPGCKHERAARQLCEEYRALSRQARRGETVRLSVGLLKALGGIAPRPAFACRHGGSAPTTARLIEIHDALDRVGYLDPNTPLPDGRVRRTAANPDGYCVKCGSRDHARCGWRVRRLNEDLFGSDGEAA